MTFASRLSFLTVEVETPLSVGCVPIDSLSWFLSSHSWSASLAIFFYPSLDALLLNPLPPPLLFPFHLFSTSLSSS